LWLHIQERHEHEHTHEVPEYAHRHRPEVLTVPILKHQHLRTFTAGVRPGHDQVLTGGGFRLSGLSAAGRVMTDAPPSSPPPSSP
jgi:hypothetical protein